MIAIRRALLSVRPAVCLTWSASVPPGLSPLSGYRRRSDRRRRVRDRFQDHLVTAADPVVVARAARAGGQQVGGLAAVPVVRAVDGGRHRHELDGGAGRLGSFSDHAERLGQGFLVDGVPDPEPDPDPRDPAAASTLAYRVHHGFAQAEFVHAAPSRSDLGDHAARRARRSMSSSTTLPNSAARFPPPDLRPMRSMAGPATLSNVFMASLMNRRVSGEAMIA